MQQDSSSLKAGTLNSSLKGGPTLKNAGSLAKGSKLTGGPTKIGQSQANKTMKKSKMASTTSEKDNDVVRHGDMIVTPKKLISDKFKELAQSYLGQLQEQQEKDKAQKSSGANKISSSVVESKSQLQSADKSSGSDIKVSSSNLQEKSSFNESKQSETNSDHDSQKGSEAVDKQAKKKNKGPSEEELDENIIVNLRETETMFLLHIPSSIVLQEVGQANGSIKRNQMYDKLLQEKIGSDNYTDRPAQTFNYQPKQKDQQSLRVEKNDTGTFTAQWDLFDAYQKDQLTECEQLQEDIKKNIDKELVQKQKNPFFMLSTDIKFISIHTKTEVPGSAQFLAEKMAKKNTTQKGVAGQSQVSGTNAQSSGQVDRDDSVKDSSSSQLGTRTNQNLVVSVSRTQKPNLQQQQQALLLQQQQIQQQLEQEEEQFLKLEIEKAKNQPSDIESSIFQNQSLNTYLSYVERILNQNTYHKQYISYRNYPEVKFEKMAADDDLGKRALGFQRNRNVKIEEDNQEQKKVETLSLLFKFSCDQSKGRTVSCADWNHVNRDLLAVSYGEFELLANQSNPNNQQGLLMFWTLKNPTYPERIIRSQSRITCCKFSENNPNLIATGTYDGVVAIYDIRRKNDKPVQENRELAGKHNDAVWEVKWVGKGGKGGDKGEGLVSISSDGRIVEWSMKKGLEYTDLMNLKKQTPPHQKESIQEGVNFRWAAGFSFDFIGGDSNMYLASTDEGTVHRCSKSYAEQYLDSYFGHSGPVYKVRCNPFFSDVFLTCSADWSAKLWNFKDEKFLCHFQALDLFDEVLDIEWSQQCSTLFATAAKDGRLELWDLTKNMLDPIADEKPEAGKTWPSRTMVRFSSEYPVLLSGDAEGDIKIYRLNGYEDMDHSIQHDKIVKLLYPTGYTKGAKEQSHE